LRFNFIPLKLTCYLGPSAASVLTSSEWHRSLNFHQAK